MKKLLLLVVFLALHQGLRAQTSQGSVVVTGSVGYDASNKSGTNNLKENTSSYLISPRIGYMVADNFEAGLFGTLHKREEDYHGRISGADKEYGESKMTEKAVGAYLKKYFFLKDKLAFSATGEASYNSVRSTHVTYTEGLRPKQLRSDYSYKTSRFEAAIRPGFSFFFSEKIALNATYGALTYSTESLDYLYYQHLYPQEPRYYKDDRKTHGLKLDLSSASSSLGLSYFF